MLSWDVRALLKMSNDLNMEMLFHDVAIESNQKFTRIKNYPAL